MRNRLILKVTIIAAVTVLLLIPLHMIGGVVAERSGYRRQVEHDIASTWTGSQLLVAPVVVVPYQVRHVETRWNKKRKLEETREELRWHSARLLAEDLSIAVTAVTEVRSRGIYSVPVYAATFSLDARFEGSVLDELRATTVGFQKWGAASVSIGISDVRGIGGAPTMIWNDRTVAFAPGTRIAGLPGGIHAELAEVPLGGPHRLALDLVLRGSQQLMLWPLARSSEVSMRSPWPHPNFGGRFLPVTREVSAQGFDARWQLSSFGTSVEQFLDTCLAGDCGALLNSGFGVHFIETVDVYQKVTRATKYGILFIVLTFIAFFLTEAMAARSLHAVHYALVGFALSIFYLLLISLSEHVDFAIAYAVATVSCAGLIGVYLTGVFANVRQGLVYSGGITALYGMLFAILRSEDFALLMGTLLAFGMLAAVMLLTRRVDWYGIGERIDLGLRGGSPHPEQQSLL